MDLHEARDDRVLGCSGISWTLCKLFAPRCRQITTAAPHHLIFADWMLFLMFNQQCQSSEGIKSINYIKYLIVVCCNFCCSTFMFVYTSCLHLIMHVYLKLSSHLLFVNSQTSFYAISIESIRNCRTF